MDIFKLQETYLKRKNSSITKSVEMFEIDSNNIIKQFEIYVKDLLHKINNIEEIDLEQFDDILVMVKQIGIEHNKQINQWFDSKYHDDLNQFITNNNKFKKEAEIYDKNCFILILSFYQ